MNIILSFSFIDEIVSEDHYGLPFVSRRVLFLIIICKTLVDSTVRVDFMFLLTFEVCQ